MAEYIPPSTTCSTCGGDGYSNGGLCASCYGTGALPVKSKLLLLLKQIIDEQASQREDLTNALAAIWDKVKTL